MYQKHGENLDASKTFDFGFFPKKIGIILRASIIMVRFLHTNVPGTK